MSRPLPHGDPTRLGPFRLTARLDETTAGIVYLGVSDDGRTVSLAVLTRGAAQDAAARDRFRAAVTAALPSQGIPGVPLSVWAPPGPEDDPSEGARVVAAQPEGPAPWVATEYDPARPGAERFLDAVMFTGSFRDRFPGARRGPQFQPYWAGSREPALAPPPGSVTTAPPRSAPEPVGRGLASTVLGLAGMLALLGLLLLLLFACRPTVSEPPPPPPTDVPSNRAPTPPPTPSRSPSSTPTPSPSGTPHSPTPSPSGTGEGDGAPA